MESTLRIFAALSGATRLRIVRLLLRRDLCVCELVFILKMSQSRVSHQLRVLRDAGLVEDKRNGQWIVYGIRPALRERLQRGLASFASAGRGENGATAEDFARLRLCRIRQIRKTRRVNIRPKGDRSWTSKS